MSGMVRAQRRMSDIPRLAMKVFLAVRRTLSDEKGSPIPAFPRNPETMMRL